MSLLEPLAPIQPVNFPGDREYTMNALIEELTLVERHVRDGSWHLCSCNPEKHLPLISGLASEGFGFAKDPEEKEFMRQLRDRARIWREKIKNGNFGKNDADDLRAWSRELRHRIEFQQWTGEMPETPELVEVVKQIHALTGDIASLEEKQVDQILTKLSNKYGIPKPKYRFINNCNPMKDAYMIGADAILKNKTGETTRIPLTDSDQLVFCRGGASPYAIAHELCHHLQRIKEGKTDEKSATECALRETGNAQKEIYKRKDFYRLSFKRGSGGILSYRAKLTKRMEGAVPLVAGVIVGEAIDASGIIDTTIAPIAGAWTGLVKGILGLGVTAAGLGMKKGAMADIVLGAGLPIAASGIIQQFFPGGLIPAPAVAAVPTALAPARTVQQLGYYPQQWPGGPVPLTAYARPFGLRFGQPTLSVPMIPPRPGILSPSTIPQALAPKFILGMR